MVLWRISNFADLKGVGGLRAPGRWHTTGRPVVYLAEHPAGALLETLVHQEIGSAADLPDTYRLLRVEVGERVKIAELGEGALPEDWREDHPISDQSRYARQVCDFLAGMTDRYALEQHKRLFDLDPLFR